MRLTSESFCRPFPYTNLSQTHSFFSHTNNLRLPTYDSTVCGDAIIRGQITFGISISAYPAVLMLVHIGISIHPFADDIRKK